MFIHNCALAPTSQRVGIHGPCTQEWDMFWAEVAQNRTFWLSYLVCCRRGCWFAQRCSTMCRHNLVAQHFCPISNFLILWLFVAKSNVFFFNGIFPILSYLSNLPCCDPEPQTTARLPPHKVVAQHFGWFCHFCSWARCAGAARRGKRGETEHCGMCKVPNTTIQI